MQKTAFLALMFATSLFACNENKSDKEPEAKTITSIENSQSPTDEILQQYLKEDSIKNEKERLTNQSAIPVGMNNFRKLVSFIEKEGAVTRWDRGHAPAQYQYTLIDNALNRHAFITSRIDEAGQLSHNGAVKNIVVYAYRTARREQEYFFPYTIDSAKVYCDIPKIDGTWPDYYNAKRGYEALLKMALREN